uniref:F-box protein PP2-A13 n=2 Tax=Anthurium amnicola TaxID=1678845 RepID=A0A1D1XR76_9ARAE
MGAGASSVAGPDGEGGHRPGLGDLPEACVASVLLHLDPPEICRVARLNRAFRRAASADFVWESKLPSNYGYLLEKLAHENNDGVDRHQPRRSKRLGKKEIYASLCYPNPFDGGTKMFWLEKYKGGICILISSKALSITGIDDRRHWNYILTGESRFHTVAYLQQIWWFQVDGEIEFCFPPGPYKMFFRLQLGRSSKRLGRRICNLEHIHGWDVKPVRFELSTSDGQLVRSQCFLDEPGNWIHYQVGEFVVVNSDVPTKVKFSLTQIDCTHTKGGLCVDSVLICPRGVRPEKVCK